MGAPGSIRAWRWIAGAGGGLALLAGLAVLGIGAFPVGRFKERVAAEISDQVGAPVTIGVFLLLAPVVAGCAENDQSTLSPKSSASDQIAHLWWVMLIGAAVIFGVVLVLLFVAVLRRRGADRAVPETTRRGGLWIPAVGGIAVPIVVLAALFALTLRTLPRTSPVSASAAGLTIEVVGRGSGNCAFRSRTPFS